MTTLVGTKSSEPLFGTADSDLIYGRGGNDTLVGRFDNDLFDRTDRCDFLFGGHGDDTFQFRSWLSRDNVDVIMDFEEGDVISLSSQYGGPFERLNGFPLILPEDALHVGTRAADRQDRIIYNENTGVLFYDADGSIGSFNKKPFAVLANHAELSHDDIFISA